MRAVLRMPGSNAAAASRSASVCTASQGAQRTPQAVKWRFSSMRSCALATACAGGDTGLRAARYSSAAAGTFSNSVVRPSQASASWSQPVWSS